ncbi:MAG: LUD domain-containing protein [Bacteroidales bacterium]|jgi:L-lactate dehydrogenase complex protein LldF
MIYSGSEQVFINNCKEAINDTSLQDNINSNIKAHLKNVQKTEFAYNDLEKTKENASYVKNKSIINLPELLVTFEAKFEANGGKVIWAQDAKEAISEITKIISRNSERTLTYDNSLILNEISLAENMKKEGVTCYPSDFHSYFAELQNETSTHYTYPFVHKSRNDIKNFIVENFTESDKYDFPYEVKDKLIEQSKKSDVYVSSANFIVADCGCLCVSENEGSNLVSSALSKVQIYVVGIDKIVPQIKDLYLLLPLYSTYSYGKKLNTYNNIIFGPKNTLENREDEEVYVILLDNGRTNVLEQKNQRRALACINCGNCSNNSAVYKSIGGKVYGSTYVGPIGAVVTPLLNGFKEWKHLCMVESANPIISKKCPININIHELILYNRYFTYKHGMFTRTEKKLYPRYKKDMLSRRRIDKLSLKRKIKMFGKIKEDLQLESKQFPNFAQSTFKQIYTGQND